MKLIVGLGNPGNKYAFTRHNAGFIILDYISEHFKSDFKAGKGDFYFLQTKFKGEDVIFIKPVTFMNNSGIAVLQILELYPSINLNDILIVYDDFQLNLGTIRIREKGSDGGHNGISNIIYHLNSMDVPRMRVGIGSGNVMKKDEFVDFVLSDFTAEEFESFKKVLPVYKECILSFIKEPFKMVMNKYNKNFLVEEKTELPPPSEKTSQNKTPDTSETQII